MGAAISLYLHMKTNTENMRQRKEIRDTEEDINKTTLNCYFESNLFTHTHSHTHTHKQTWTQKRKVREYECVCVCVCVFKCECVGALPKQKQNSGDSNLAHFEFAFAKPVHTHTKGFNQYGGPPTSRHPFLLFISFSASKPSSRSII